MRIRAWLWLSCTLVLFLATASRFLPQPPLETDLLALLPATERNPVAEQAATRLGRLTGERALFLVGLKKTEDARAAADRLAAGLKAGDLFKQVVTRVPMPDPGILLDLYSPHLTSLDRGPADYTARLAARLASPFAGGALPLERDPFGLMDAWIEALPIKQFRLDLDQGWLTARAQDRVWVLVSAELAGSAFDPVLQRALTERLASVEAELAQRWPEVRLLRVGAIFHASAAREAAEREMHLIGTGSLLGIILLLALAYRSPAPLALGLFSVAVGLSAAMLSASTVFERLHLMTLVFGASLIGEAVDYAIQYFSARQGAGAGWRPMAGLRAVGPGLAVALGTSIVGYSALALTPFPALRQVAVFAISGLLAAWLTVMLTLPAWLARPARPAPAWMSALPARWIALWRARARPRGLLALALLLTALAATGWVRLVADDDVRQLIQIQPDLADQEARFRAITGFEAGSQFFLVEGVDMQQALEREEILAARLNHAGIRLQGVSGFTPSCRRQQENHARLAADLPAQRQALDAAGFRPAAVRAWEDNMRTTPGCLHPEAWLTSPFSIPFRHLRLDSASASLLSLPAGFTDVKALARAARGLPGVTLVDKPGAVSRLFAEYRRFTTQVLAGASTLILLLLVWRYGWRGGCAILLPTLLAQGLALGLLGHLGAALNLFHLLALLLVLGVGINYAIFLVEGMRGGPERESAALLGVVLSALTTLLSFGLLGLSSMPALAGFGLTLALGISISLLLAPAALILSPGRTEKTP